MKYSKEWRERLGLTQLELSKLCGVSIRTVQNWDMGGNVPAASLYKLEAIENGGGLRLGRLFCAKKAATRTAFASALLCFA